MYSREVAFLATGLTRCFAERRGWWTVSVRVPVLYGTGLRNRIQAVGFTPAGAQDSCVYLVYLPLFLMWC